MAATDGPLCRHGWSTLPQVVPLYSKPEKQWLQLQIDLYILTDEFEVTIKIFRNNAMQMYVCCDSESSLAAKTTFFSYSFTNRDLGHNWLQSSALMQCCHRGSQTSV